MRVWRIALFAGVLILAVIGIAVGNIGSGLIWAVLAAMALVGEVVHSRTGGAGSLKVATLQLALVSLTFVAGAAALVVAAVRAPSEDQRNNFIGAAVLVVPMAAVACWVTVAGYQRVRRTSTESHRSQAEVYAELVREARTRPPDPQRPQRQRKLRIFIALIAVGWLIGILTQTIASQWGPVSAAIAGVVGLVLMLGGAFAAGWTSVWVFKDKGPAENAEEREE